MIRTLVVSCLTLVLCSAALLSETIYTKRKTNALREGAGSYYSMIGSVGENITLVVLARSGSWIKVQLPNKQVGWIAANSLKAEKDDSMVARSSGAMWSSPKALSAAIKGFGKKYEKANPAIVDSVLRYSDAGFTSEQLAEFTADLRKYPSRNRGKVEIEDLDLPAPDYYADLPEQQIGVGVSARIAAGGMVNNASLHRYVNMVCATVAEQSPAYDADLTVLVLNDKTINAFAVPGGYIFVTLGLLRQCNDESELAGTIAHEIAHVYRRHGLQELSQRLPQIKSGDAFRELEEEVGDTSEEARELEALADQAYEKVVHPRLLSYEVEADRIGAILAANAGYDPFGLVRLSERVARVSKESPDIFDADYMLPDDAVIRSKEIRAYAEKSFTTGTPGERMSKRFLSVTSPLR